MALSEPQSIDIDGTTTSLPRTSAGHNTSTYTSASGSEALTVAHTYGGKRIRRLARIQQNKISADPLSTNNIRVSASARITLDVPDSGFTTDEAAALCSAIADWATANAARFAGGEN